MKNLLIRTAQFYDINTMLILEDACFKTDKLSKRQLQYLLGRAKAISLIAERENQILGYAICLVPMHPRPARLYSIAVLPEYQGQGIAKKLMSNLLLLLQEKQYQHCRLEVRESQLATQALYGQFGFTMKRHLPFYYQDGEAAIRMEANVKA